jgi:hypothetical protein
MARHHFLPLKIWGLAYAMDLVRCETVSRVIAVGTYRAPWMLERKSSRRRKYSDDLRFGMPRRIATRLYGSRRPIRVQFGGSDHVLRL